MAQMRPVLKDAYHIALALAMVLLILGLVTWSGVISCRDVPGWCSVYYAIKGPPKTLIVYGENGLGDPDALQQLLRNPTHAAATNISKQDVAYISAGNLKNYDLVIVTRAKMIPTAKIKAFMEYADSGGRLVWTGDAGTQIAKEDVYLYADDIDANAEHVLLNQWARKDNEKNEAVRFDQYISADYKGNWCELRDCQISQQVGKLVPESGADHRLIYGISNNLRLYGDFALVSDKGIGSTIVMSVDTETNVTGQIASTGVKINAGRVFPLLITSGIGEKVVYYAVPPELLAQPPMQYLLFIENLYNGMLR